MTASPSLRDRHTARTRAALIAASLELFRERGFTATTVEEIASRADVAPRTFFRYFPTKEAVLFHDQEDQLAELRSHLAERPADEPAHESLVAVLIGFVGQLTADPEHLLLISRLAAAQPELFTEQRRTLVDRFGEALAADLAARQGLVEPTLGLRAQAASLMVCMALGLAGWVQAGATGSPVPYVREALTAAAQAFTLAIAHTANTAGS